MLEEIQLPKYRPCLSVWSSFRSEPYLFGSSVSNKCWMNIEHLLPVTYHAGVRICDFHLSVSVTVMQITFEYWLLADADDMSINIPMVSLTLVIIWTTHFHSESLKIVIMNMVDFLSLFTWKFLGLWTVGQRMKAWKLLIPQCFDNRCVLYTSRV